MREQEFLNILRKDLKKRMKFLRLKQKDVCLLTGICQSVLSAFLSGKRGLSADTYIKLHKIVYSNDKNMVKIYEN